MTDRAAARPFAAHALPLQPAAKRELSLWGAHPVELVWLPDRGQRRARAGSAFLSAKAERIVREEASWTCADPPAVLTPNRYPFADDAAILWSAVPAREAEAGLIALAHDLAEPHAGCVLMNTIGAAATVPRAHLHLCRGQLPFLQSLPLAAAPELPPLPADVQVRRAATPFPGMLLRVDGPRRERVACAARLLELRSTAAANLVSDGGSTWVALRAHETPAPFFPWPLGCSELWGRWCFESEQEFAAADAAALEQALAMAMAPAA